MLTDLPDLADEPEENWLFLHLSDEKMVFFGPSVEDEHESIAEYIAESTAETIPGAIVESSPDEPIPDEPIAESIAETMPDEPIAEPIAESIAETIPDETIMWSEAETVPYLTEPAGTLPTPEGGIDSPSWTDLVLVMDSGLTVKDSDLFSELFADDAESADVLPNNEKSTVNQA